MKRAVITGIGLVTPLGIGIDNYWRNIKRNISGLSYEKDYESFNFNSRSYGVVRGFDGGMHGLSQVQLRRMDRITQFGMVAANEALENSGIEISKEDPEKISVNIANAVAGTKFMDEEFLVLTNLGKEKVTPEEASPYSYAKSMPNSTSSEVAAMVGAKGEVVTIATGCTAGIDSVGYALDKIRMGDAEVVICGAAEAPITPVTIAAFEAICTLSSNNNPPENASRPFCKTRNGFVLGESAGVLIVEEYKHAKNRGADIYAEISGYASMNNAIHMTGLHPEGRDIAQSIEMVLQDSRVSKDQIKYISAHGSGTRQNDTSETAAYKKVFGEKAYEIPISSLKSIIGHSLGAATATEIATCCLSMKDGYLTPTLNYFEKDETCDLDYIPNEGREVPIDCILKNASGFSGIHSTMILKKV